jgi:hypothetical protein
MDSGNDATRREDITGLLSGFRQGDSDVEARLIELTYRELRKIAAGHLRREHSARSLQTTDLVHEGYLRPLWTRPPIAGAAAGISIRLPRMIDQERKR